MRRRRTPVTEIIFSAAQFHKLSLAPGAETDPPLSCEELGIQDPLQFAGMSLLTMFQAEEDGMGQRRPWHCWRMAGLHHLSLLHENFSFSSLTSSVIL